MTTIRNVLAGTILAGGALLAGATMSIATAADAPADATATTPDEGHWHGHHHGHGGWIYHQLGLTDAQKAQIKTIRKTSFTQMQPVFQQMRANHLKLQQTQPNDPNYAGVAAEVSQANAPLHAQLETQQATVRAEIFNSVLTKAQQTQLQTLEAQMQARRAAHEAGGR